MLISGLKSAIHRARRLLVNLQTLADENRMFAGTGGVSQDNRHCGFQPAFLDAGGGEVYLSRFADGRPAPVHVLDGLPSALVVTQTPGGRATAARGRVISGFVRAGRFYTREQTAEFIAAGNKWANATIDTAQHDLETQVVSTEVGATAGALTSPLHAAAARL